MFKVNYLPRVDHPGLLVRMRKTLKEETYSGTQRKQHGWRHENMVHVRAGVVPPSVWNNHKEQGEIARDGAEQVIRGRSWKSLYVNQMGFCYFFLSFRLRLLIRGMICVKYIH